MHAQRASRTRPTAASKRSQASLHQIAMSSTHAEHILSMNRTKTSPMDPTKWPVAFSTLDGTRNSMNIPSTDSAKPASSHAAYVRRAPSCDTREQGRFVFQVWHGHAGRFNHFDGGPIFRDRAHSMIEVYLFLAKMVSE